MALKGKKFKKEKKSIKSTLKNALSGLSYAFETQINFRLHIVATVLVLFFCYWLEVNVYELSICLLLIALVLTLELLNTIVEVIVDMVEPNYNDLAKIAKDMSAGAVLVVSVMAAIIGIIIFLPKLLIVTGIV